MYGGPAARFDAFQRRHPVVGFPIGVADKFFDDRGPHLAALITYYGFVSLLLLQTVGVSYFSSYLNRQGDVYGIFGVVLGLVVWIYLQALVVVLAAEINVVREHRLFPRSLLTPFTDDVDLTEPDVRAYSSYAPGGTCWKYAGSALRSTP